MLTLTLPWPARELHPNGRIIWQVKQNYIRIAREEARLVTLSANGDMRGYSGQMTARFIFCPPNKAKRDLDGLLSSIKPNLDGIMDALQTNDNQIVEISARWGDVVKGGSVTVEIGAFEKVNMSANEDEYSVFCEMCGARL